jgi:hypothetical protein
MSTIIEIDYFNSFILKKVAKTDNTYGVWPNLLPANTAASGSAINYFPGDASTSGDELQTNYYVEEARIRGGYNNTFTDYGVRAYLAEDNDEQQDLKNSLIHSGIYNSRTGVNNTNQFSIGESITRSLNPVNGGIQRLYATNTNLNVFQENKVSYALIDKDTIYTAEGGTQTQAANVVLGQVVPYSGEYGISKNPESFAYYGRRMYFSDRNRNAIIRLSVDGVTEINRYGMFDYFRDELGTITEEFQRYVIEATSVANTGTSFVLSDNGDCVEYGMSIEQGGATPSVLDATVTNIQYDTPGAGQWTITASKSITVTTETNFVKLVRDKIEGGWDIHNKNYIVSTQQGVPTNGDAVTCGTEQTYNTVAYEEDVRGWTSFYSYRPNAIDSLKNKFYSFKSGSLWEHYDENTNLNRSTFYGTNYPASITFLFNDNPSLSKNFNTVSYEGSSGWKVEFFKSDLEGMDYQFYTTPAGGFTETQDTTNSVLSFLEGKYETNTPTNIGTSAVTPPFSYAGFARKENRYVANLVNNSTARPGEVIFGTSMSGIKGFFAEVKFSTDNVTQVGGMKELFSASTNFVTSSY